MQEAANGCGTIFLLKLNQLLPKCAYHVCIGNLEYDWPLQPWKPDWSNAVYGTDGGCLTCQGTLQSPLGPVLLDSKPLYISTKTNFVSGSSQYNFIKQDLESVNRSKTPFVVDKTGSSSGSQDQTTQMIQSFHSLTGLCTARGGEFKEKLTLTCVGNQDGQMHDMVEILASGEVLSGGDSISKEAGDRIKLIDSTFPWYVKGCSSWGLLWAIFSATLPFPGSKMVAGPAEPRLRSCEKRGDLKDYDSTRKL
ncbi:hypothetical protein POTOM_029697 [Populus tomentosa]|uniref:Uncharacterized protein n=1 Tax=Populus tomentosa TaxID=118781 RepID=A0A8X7ZDM3_POPTO|nr:hypothetical protein POTOM_029697 [Populus tomentosa]